MENFVEASYPLREQKGKLHIKVYKPEKDQQAPNIDYFCAFEIEGPDLQVQSRAFGIDPLQALWLTLKRIRLEVQSYEARKKIKCEYFFNVGPEEY